MSILTDKTGDKSSKRLVGITTIFTAIILSVIIVIYGLSHEVPNPTLINSVLTGLYTSGSIALGLSATENFAPNKTKGDK